MTDWHGYFLIDNQLLTDGQKVSLFSTMRGLGASAGAMPAYVRHWRTSLNGSITLVEAVFDDDNLVTDNLREILADVIVARGDDIVSSSSTVSYGGVNQSDIISLDYGAGTQVKVTFFGTLTERWLASKDECVSYLIQNIGRWEGNK